MSDFSPREDWRERETIEPDQRPAGVMIFGSVPRGMKIVSRGMSLKEIVGFIRASSHLVIALKVPKRERFFVLEF